METLEVKASSSAAAGPSSPISSDISPGGGGKTSALADTGLAGEQYQTMLHNMGDGESSMGTATDSGKCGPDDNGRGGKKGYWAGALGARGGVPWFQRPCPQGPVTLDPAVRQGGGRP